VIYSSKPFYLKPLWNAYAAFLKPRDQEIIRERIDLILANSNNVKERVKKYYGVDSEVVYSPIATSRYMFKKFGDFFLTVNRLIPEKRVDVIVEAFTRMHGKKLVVVGEGPQLPYLKKIAGNSRNVQFLGNVGEDALAEMYGECLATVYMPYHEDYGMVPLEGNAAGKPCISVEEGGCRETVLPGKTGFFIKPDVESLVEQVNALDLDTVRSMRDECISWASQFDESVFKERLVDLIQRRY
jgi:glycosyltransferase involved in cell wall biosynthesis